MKKMITVIVMIILAFSTLTAKAHTLNHPSIPKEPSDAKKAVIIILDRKKSEQEIKRLVQSDPSLELGHIYKYAINGFSVKGTQESINRLSKKIDGALVSSVNTYEIQEADNIELIGGKDIRGYFNRKNERLTGKGIKVGVIDTGIDYSHPDLKINYGGGQDLVDGDNDPMETKGTDEESTLHGTHVAGIIAANGKIQGVAPESTIFAYRALGPGGRGTTEQVIAAIDQAIKDKVDVLNLSLGNSVNGPDLPTSIALNKAVDHGIISVTSSGNSGPDIWTVGSPGTASKAISVGASTPTLKIPHLGIDGRRIRLDLLAGSAKWDFNKPYEIAFGGLGTKKELKNVDGKIVLIERGEYSFAKKAMNAYMAGAIGVIIYNNTHGRFTGSLETKVPIPAAAISREDGEKIKGSLDKRRQFAKTYIIEEKDKIADFSSRGPVTSSWEIKPDIVAPGVSINSTIPGGYLSLQGTSMAAPHVAGAAALIKQAHPEWGPEKVKAALMNTAKELKTEQGKPYRAYEQGAGRIQIEEAINTETLVIPASLQFGKFLLSDRQHEHSAYVTVENTGTKTQYYSFAVPKAEDGLNWHLPLSFHLKPGERKKVEIKLSVDPNALNQKIYDGNLILNTGNQKIRIPYLYVLEEPTYPRVMGFGFGKGDKQNVFRYEVYLPGGAEEFGIAVFDAEHLRFTGFLDWKRNVGRGHLVREIPDKQLPHEGIYLIKVFAKKSGKEDWIETYLHVSSDGEIEEFTAKS